MHRISLAGIKGVGSEFIPNRSSIALRAHDNNQFSIGNPS